MKNYFKIAPIALFFSIATFVTSCSSDDAAVTPAPAPVDNTITGKAVATADLSILVAALQKTGLASVLQGAGSFTVFAPKNSAFSALNISVASINNMTPTELNGLKETLLSHVVSGTTTSTQLMNNSYLKTLGSGAASTTSKLSMLVNKGATVKLNNNATVITPDVVASNGIIHIVDKVITAPTIVDLVATNTNFSDLVNALSTTGLVPTFQTSTFYTVFAPDNAAFTALAAEITPLVPSTAQLTNILKYHVVSGNVNASGLVAGSVATINPQPFTVSLTGGANITGSRVPARSASTVTTTDIQANNGVIHVLNKVLLPATF